MYSRHQQKDTRCHYFVRTDKRRSIVSINPTDLEFYTIFTSGLESRIGQRVKRDCAVSIALGVVLQKIAEEDWKGAVQNGDLNLQYEVAEWASYFLCTFWETVKAIISTSTTVCG
jgi:hypothetical protein